MNEETLEKGQVETSKGLPKLQTPFVSRSMGCLQVPYHGYRQELH